MTASKAAVALLAAIALTSGCGLSEDSPAASASGSSGDSGTIKIGSVNALSGPVTFPDSSSAAKAVFDRVNAQGGINGREIEYIVTDDKGDPAAAAQAARDLVTNQGVVALAGSASLVDCAVNAPFYTQSGIVSVQGTGVDPTCFSSAAISPVNAGPYLNTAINLYYASEVLKRDKVCSFLAILGNTNDAYGQAIASWTKLTGKTPVVDDRTVKPDSDPTPFVLRAKKEGCQAVLYNGTEPMAIAWMKAVKQQNITGIDWLMTTAPYTDAVAKALGTDGDGMYANAEFEPFTQADSSALADWRSLMTEKNVPLTSFGQGGYLAATHLVDTLRSIQGPITRESVAKAFKELKPIESPLTGTPYEFGDAAGHMSNKAGKIVQLEGGQWRVVTPDWVRYPGTLG
ncbi:ABC transporter substrate-binding protein [Sphaerimonospora thailandensis]|uniref:Branched-chain amino acid ABC transporter substrate-binding protein n=1 Tax=Sphaerimonospora thailandensis TaxID=795644 RepID=A0A8J3RAW8_9ACTN|nr:ABC transporter substrate-binding protein [Sphaerimonospora thailandensis]GIH70941.1 branched-chain amino acid ABC transporter substrate-binding protein [Sphaerimonospora thailandensis]